MPMACFSNQVPAGMENGFSNPPENKQPNCPRSCSMENRQWIDGEATRPTRDVMKGGDANEPHGS